MDSDKNAQVEDKPAEQEIERKQAVEIISSSTVKKGVVDRALPWVIVGLVCFLAGALLTWFVVSQPKVLELEAAQTKMAAAAETNAETTANMQKQIDTLNADLTVSNENLVSAQATIEAQIETITKTELLKVIYKFQSDVNVARATLSKEDPSSSRQALSFVSDDLVELEKAGLDPDSISGFKAKIEDAEANLNSENSRSLEALESLYTNLLLLINNLK